MTGESQGEMMDTNARQDSREDVVISIPPLPDDRDLPADSRSAARVVLAQFSTAVQRRAARVPDGDVRRDADYPTVWWVRSGEGDREYRVQVLSLRHATCTCPHGLRRASATCYHVLAVLSRL